MTTRIVIMGVSGCGKSTVGQMLSEQLDLSFIDGDHLHPPSNIEKMSKGIPLDDSDRAPWLAEVGKVLANAKGSTAIACSALKRTYRDIIRAETRGAVFVHLHASKSVLAQRVNARQGHFMPPALLDSQFATLEMLGQDEAGVTVNIDQPLDDVVLDARRYITERAI